MPVQRRLAIPHLPPRGRWTGLRSCSVQRDVAAQKTLPARLKSVALRDPVPGLPNRTAFDPQLSGITQRYGGPYLLCGGCVIDLNDFRPINDVHGHEPLSGSDTEVLQEP